MQAVEHALFDPDEIVETVLGIYKQGGGNAIYIHLFILNFSTLRDGHDQRRSPVDALAELCRFIG